MKLNIDKHHRRSLRLKEYDYSQAGAYFVTICVKDRKCLFGNIVDGERRLNDAGNLVLTTWHDLPNHNAGIELDEFIIMPNHFHGILLINHMIHNVGTPRWGVQKFQRTRHRRVPTKTMNKFWKPNSLGSIINQFKSIVTKRIRINGNEKFAWQPRYYEHIIRNEKDMERIQEYIINNPVQWESDENNPRNIKLKL